MSTRTHPSGTDAKSSGGMSARVRVWLARRRSSCEHNPYVVRETDGTWDNDYTHAWTQVRAALRPRGIVHRCEYVTGNG
eukprot:651482-Prymnesium_polylepis.1